MGGSGVRRRSPSAGRRRWKISARIGIDALVIDEGKAETCIEWKHFKTCQNRVLRGSEWIEFDRASGLIKEIRAYYASPQDAEVERLELGGFDYKGREYSLVFSR